MAVASTLRGTDDAREVFDETALVGHSAAPLLVVHGDADDVSSVQRKEVFDAPERPETRDAPRAFFASV